MKRRSSIETLSSVVKSNHLVDQVIAVLQRLIREGAYKPGERLPSEAQLCAQFKVGRSTVREAMRVLAHVGLVDTWAGRGSFVAQTLPEEPAVSESMSIDEIDDIYRFRFSVEKEAAGLAAKLHTPEQLSQMVYHLTSAKTAVTARDVAATIVRGTDFHIAILDGGRCHFAASLYRANRPTIEGALRCFISLTGPLAPSSSPHAAQYLYDKLLAAIERRDGKAATAIVESSRREVETRLRLARKRQAESRDRERSR
jgi:GntR family transcriptional regulator, transcriptional repressor for pyruvate dehydrogenase complex